MKKLLTISILFLISLAAYSQLSYQALLSSFDGFDNGEFETLLIENGFVLNEVTKKALASETWHYDAKEKGSGEIIIEKKTFPWNTLWVEFIRHSKYHEIRSDIIKYCDHTGFFGCSEVETWDSYKHSSGIEFRLVELPESRETGKYVIEIIQK